MFYFSLSIRLNSAFSAVKPGTKTDFLYFMMRRGAYVFGKILVFSGFFTVLLVFFVFRVSL